jgi:siroheme synthase (precorrin-2 oxidase/ferrochelatase)
VSRGLGETERSKLAERLEAGVELVEDVKVVLVVVAASDARLLEEIMRQLGARHIPEFVETQLQILAEPRRVVVEHCVTA